MAGGIGVRSVLNGRRIGIGEKDRRQLRSSNASPQFSGSRYRQGDSGGAILDDRAPDDLSMRSFIVDSL